VLVLPEGVVVVWTVPATPDGTAPVGEDPVITSEGEASRRASGRCRTGA